MTVNKINTPFVADAAYVYINDLNICRILYAFKRLTHFLKFENKK